MVNSKGPGQCRQRRRGGQKRPEKGQPRTGRRLKRRSQGDRRKPTGDNDVTKPWVFQEEGSVVPNA